MPNVDIEQGKASSMEKAEGSKTLGPTEAEIAAITKTRYTRRRRASFGDLFLVATALLLTLIITLPIYFRRAHSIWWNPFRNIENGVSTRLVSDPSRPIMVVNDFPDPGLVEYNGTWYSFGTNQKFSTTDIHVPIAVSQDFKNWTVVDQDALPDLGAWELPINHWAPDVIRRDDGKFVLYYSGQVRRWGRHHCVGVAVSKDTSPLGPYVPTDEPLACPRDAGGAIDPAPFRDADDKLYVTYKADGNSAGNGGHCGNGIEPIVDTPIMLQELESDGVTPVGDPVPILHRTDDDGPLVEAPRIVRSQEGIYFLHFSSHCFTSPKYDVKYATSTSLKGPYTRAPEPLVKWGDYGLVAPGGASISSDGTKILFHANCGIYRCTYAGAVTLNQTTISMAKL